MCGHGEAKCSVFLPCHYASAVAQSSHLPEKGVPDLGRTERSNDTPADARIDMALCTVEPMQVVTQTTRDGEACRWRVYTPTGVVIAERPPRAQGEMNITLWPHGRVPRHVDENLKRNARKRRQNAERSASASEQGVAALYCG